MNKDKQSFVYLWMDSKNKMWYLGSHCGNNPTYAHSSAVMESFTMRNKPHYMKRRILAYGSNEDMIQLEHNLIEKYNLVQREDYYNLANGFPFPSGPSHPSYIHGRSNDTEYFRDYMKEYRQKPEVKKYIKEYMREYEQRPEVKERKREYMREYDQRPEVIEYRKEYYQRPEVKEKNKLYMREYMKEYAQKPEVKKRQKEYMKEYRQKKRALNI